MVLYQRQANLSNVDTDPITHRPKRKQTSTLNPLPSHVHSIKEFNVSGKRPNPDNLLGNVDLSWDFTPHKASKLEAEQLDQALILCRMCPTKLFTVNIDNPSQCMPGWSAFNASASSYCPELSIVGFCPMLPAPATDYSTIFTVMDNLQRMMEKLGQKSSVLTFDQALYRKAKEIQWRMADRFQNFFLRLGGFHVVMVFLAVLGKMFRDSGLDDALADSGVYACNTVGQIFRGSHYNRGIRCHKLALESMCRLQWLAVIEL